MKSGPLHLRGTLRWKWRRALSEIRYGNAAFQDLPIIIGNAIPKSGSTLLFNLLRGFEKLGPFIDTGLPEVKPYTDGQLTDPAWILRELNALRPGDIRLGYFHALPHIMDFISSTKAAHFFIIRDPRDALVSSIFFAMDINPAHFHHDFIVNLKDMEERLLFAINGEAEGEFAMADVGERYERWSGWWSGDAEVCLIRFEELVSNPEEELARMLNYIKRKGFDPKLDLTEMVEILREQMAPSKSSTFRKGTSGEWRKYFTGPVVDEFKKYAGDTLIRMGYEENSEW